MNSLEGLYQALDGIKFAFFSDDLEKRESIQMLRTDIGLRAEDSNSIYFAYAYFFQEQLRPVSVLELASVPFLCSLFESGWFLYVTAKTSLLVQNKFDSLESLYLLLSLMLTLDTWARSLELPSDASAALRASAAVGERLAGVSEIINTKLLNWRIFHRTVFTPWASENLPPMLRPFVRLRLSTASAAMQNDPQPLSPLPTTLLKSLNDLEPILTELHAQSTALVDTSPVSLLEFDETAMARDLPLLALYSPDPAENAAEVCFNAMLQLQSYLQNVRWMHAYSTSKPKKQSREVINSSSNVRSPSSPSAPLHGSPAAPIAPSTSNGIPITIESVIPEARLHQIREMMDQWSRQLLESTPLPSAAVQLTNDLFLRTLLDTILDDVQRANELQPDDQPITSPLIGKDYFLATLYSAVFEVAIFCSGQADCSPFAFPFILEVTKVQPMDLCKILNALAVLFGPPSFPGPIPISSSHSAPKTISMFVSHLEEKVYSELLWRYGSSIFVAYNQTMKDYFSYVLSYAGPPHKPRLSIHAALTSPGMVEKFQKDSATSSETNWDSHNIIFKMLRIGCTRIRVICRAITVLSEHPTAMQQAEHAFAFAVTQRTSILAGRNIDTFVICTIFSIGLALSGADSKSPEATLFLQRILHLYNSMAICNEAAVNLIPIPHDLDAFYNGHASGNGGASIRSSSPAMSSSTMDTSPPPRMPSSQSPPSSSPNPTVPVRPERLRFVHIREFYESVFVPELRPILDKFHQPERHMSSGNSPYSLHHGSHPLHSPRSIHRPNGQGRDRLASITKRLDFSPYVDPPHVLNQNAASTQAAPSPAAATPTRATRATASAKRFASKPKPKGLAQQPTILPYVNTPPRTRPKTEEDDEDGYDAPPLNGLRAPRKRREATAPPAPHPGFENDIDPKRPRLS